MPKIESPFVRKEINGIYVCTPEIAKGYEWVFDDTTVLAIEKLHGTNVSIVIENGVIASIWNRTERIPFFNKGKTFIVEGVLEAFQRGYCELPDGQWFGEVMGPKLQGNPYNLDRHLWVPFATYAKNHLAFKSWGKYPKDYETIRKWFKDGLLPLFSMRFNGRDEKDGKMNPKTGKPHFVEGVVFTHPDGRMAKLRRDMFDDFDGERHGRGKEGE